MSSKTNHTAEPAIVVTNLVKHYGSLKAVDDLTFTVKTSEIFALLGPNGAGKTTTIEMLEGYRKADSGSVCVLGLNPTTQAHTVKEQIGIMLQQTTIYDQIRVGEAVRMFASYYDDARDPDQLIEMVGLKSHVRSYFGTLSGGQKQRLSLALALVGNPKLVFLDEPTSSMDPQARLRTWELIRELRKSGVTILLTTHFMEEAQRLSDRVAIIDHGRLIALGTPEELIGSSATEIITFTGPPAIDLEVLRAYVPGNEMVEERPGAYSITTTDALAVAAQLHTWRSNTRCSISDFRVSSPTLEDIFLKLTGSEVRD